MNTFEFEYKNIINNFTNSTHNVFIQEMRRISKAYSLILYGCGEVGKKVIQICHQNDIPISAISDTYRRGMFQGFDIIPPEALRSKFKKRSVVITSTIHETSIKEKLILLGFIESEILTIPITINQYFSINDFENNHLQGFCWAYNFFSDKVSKRIILNRIRMHILGELLIKTTEKTEYFEIPMSKCEIFVQAGCFNGNTVIKFISEVQQINATYMVYSFEADPQSYQVSKHNLDGLPNVELVPEGLWSSQTTLKLAMDNMKGGASFVVGELNTPVSVTTIDAFFSDKVNKPTFIQLDIEGAELEALKGCENIIRRFKPKLAICVYHKPEDIYVITKLLVDYRPDYKFWLQQCYDGTLDTLLYAI